MAVVLVVVAAAVAALAAVAVAVVAVVAAVAVAVVAVVAAVAVAVVGAALAAEIATSVWKPRLSILSHQGPGVNPGPFFMIPFLQGMRLRYMPAFLRDRSGPHLKRLSEAGDRIVLPLDCP
jgi:hypothetical protein